MVEQGAGRLIFVDIPQGRLMQADLRKPGPATEITRIGMSLGAVAPPRGALHCWGPRHGVRTVVEGLTLPNGLGWSPDDSVFYLADSMRRVVLAADFDVRTGALGTLRELIRIGGGLPDGLCVDEDGCLWLAVWGAAEVRRYDPRGRHLATVRFPVSQPSSCAFGADGVLYVTSALEGTDAAREPLAGSVFAVEAGVRGVPAGIFEV
ncbi:SMP-30/gluconolactonase/LRE family protein [Catenulispora rubra]|uniref:SMP-30/gluconolactonase/LRE family protein n=1 Tax=Catenulispora rubra TaxID=280293 RepID=UPI0018927F44|nr:SMP-30/gluconolactonase/LRE family protein [Catenulispora rubra]